MTDRGLTARQAEPGRTAVDPISDGADKKGGTFRNRLEFSDPARFSGAGEGIRTLDPNLGKVVLYP